VTYRFVDEHRDIWPVRVMCRVLGVSASGYYAWQTRGESPRAKANRALLGTIRAIHAESGGAYGAPRVHAVLRSHGRRVGRRGGIANRPVDGSPDERIARLMRGAGLRGLAAIPRRVRTTDSRHDHPIAPNRLRRNFTATAPNQVWLADLTYIRTGEGWLFLAALNDMFTRKVVGWAVRDTLHADIALEALAMAVERQRPAPGLIHHSDRGVQRGLNRSSQRSGDGGCDDDWDTAVCAIDTEGVAVSGQAAGVAPRGAGRVLGGDRGRAVERGRGGRGWRIDAGGNAVVPEVRRHGANPSVRLGQTGVRTLSVVSGARRDRPDAGSGPRRTSYRPNVEPRGVDDLAGAAAQRSHAGRCSGLPCDDGAMAC